ncbi:hypothetical protein [Chromobacterium subtsugae]|nr:hypothetical protein [Chromobacterium subtsugae]
MCEIINHIKDIVPLETPTISLLTLQVSERIHELISLIEPRLPTKTDQQMIIEKTFWPKGHAYCMANLIMPFTGNNFLPQEADAIDRTKESIRNFMGGKTKMIESTDSENTAIFPQGDQIEWKTFSSAQRDQSIISGIVAKTTSNHAFNGYLAHSIFQKDGKYYAVRVGAGAYPVSGLGSIIDFINTQLGPQIWQYSDWAVDYKKHGREKFQQFYGNDALKKTENLLRSETPDFYIDLLLERQLRQDDFHVHNHLEGESEYNLKTLINLGWCTRTIQKNIMENI